MVLPHPLHKRLLSRLSFYGGVACYLWLIQFVEQQSQHHEPARQTASFSLIN